MFTISDLLRESSNEDERLAEDPSTPDSVLSKLADSPYPEVKRRVALNPNASLNTLAKVFLWQSAAVFENQSFVLSLLEDPSMEHFVKLVYENSKISLLRLQEVLIGERERIRGEYEQLFYIAAVRALSSIWVTKQLIKNRHVSDEALVDALSFITNSDVSTTNRNGLMRDIDMEISRSMSRRSEAVGTAIANLYISSSMTYSNIVKDMMILKYYDFSSKTPIGLGFNRRIYEHLKSYDSGGEMSFNYTKLLKKLARSLP